MGELPILGERAADGVGAGHFLLKVLEPNGQGETGFITFKQYDHSRFWPTRASCAGRPGRAPPRSRS